MSGIQKLTKDHFQKGNFRFGLILYRIEIRNIGFQLAEYPKGRERYDEAKRDYFLQGKTDFYKNPRLLQRIQLRQERRAFFQSIEEFNTALKDDNLLIS